MRANENTMIVSDDVVLVPYRCVLSPCAIATMLIAFTGRNMSLFVVL